VTATAVVVVNFGSHALIEQNLGGLDLPGAGARAVVVDNHRSDADAAAVAEVCDRHGWQLLAMGRNAGFGTAVNAGAAAALDAGCDVVVVVNPDLAVSAEVIAALAAAVRADPASVVSPVITKPDGGVWFRGAHVDLDGGRTRSQPGPGSPRTPPWLTGACLAVHRDVWQAVGGFDDDFFLYWEDVDLSYRMVRAGARLVVREDLGAVHDVGGTQHAADQRAKSPVYYYFNCRNRLLFAAKHLPPRDRWRWLLRTPADARRVVLRGGRRQLLRPWTCVWPAARGAAAGTVRLARARR
jgi:N-acetylglucosaminyl-diphospho-decaprenol L-rhamnosyltransferase